ncbi:MAG TPA: ATP-binding cassette domain-containing protein [Holophaga sp.]|nr:ATP-binding cassette domain-containing protein [Holophaga sp.]
MIKVRDLVKEFTVSKRGSGLSGALLGLGRRRRETVRALDGVSFDVPGGDLVGFIGPNGAGKSTTIKILAGIMRPTSGEVQANGRVPWKDRIAHVRRIGVVFGQRTQLWWDLPVRESFSLVGAMYRMPAVEVRASFRELDEALGLGPLLDVPVRQLSLGQRMRCELAAALLPRPDTLFLDEPTIGLDAPSKLAVRDFVARINRERGVTTLLTTHDMDDVAALARRVVLIRSGQTLFDGPLSSLREVAREKRSLVVDLSTAASAQDGAPPLEGMRLDSIEGNRVRWDFDPRAVRTADAIAAATARLDIVDLVVEAEPVERLIARVYGGSPARDGAR